jgi:hypothetical protein
MRGFLTASLLVLLGLLAAIPFAEAQQNPGYARVVQSCGSAPYSYQVGQPAPILVDINGNFCGPGAGSSPVATVPPKITAYGTIASVTSSAALSTLTKGPNSPNWSTNYPSKYVAIRNSVGSSDTLYVCWFGGTCSASVGEPIAQGESAFRNVGNGVDPTLFSTGGATVIGEE